MKALYARAFFRSITRAEGACRASCSHSPVRGHAAIRASASALERSSIHLKAIRSVKLVPAAQGKSACLIEHNSHLDFWPNGKNTKTEAEWEIGLDELIAFIKANAKRNK
ncbi:hypothetical protein EOS_03065 [Caballeronia mineralivorans PML1(12)]|uniref:Uncharacterized protein n=1 Tax=Caballeronia mineralivorans PML1(12) TaxID=908627 RepID=A0A0J1D4Q4_9BURK|nr:hypothetical protein [Caballeronia mineralivorans]KLU27697.1 hypothetical protein EOS_03065 [Caballeronia mineralivorans PML1(12)]